MLKDEIELIRFLLRHLVSVVILFFIIPALIIATIIGMVTGLTWKVLGVALLLFITLLIIEKIVLHQMNKPWQIEWERKQKEINKVKYVIIK